MNTAENIELFEMPPAPVPGDRIAVWFSCGAASAVALSETIKRYPECQVRALNNFILEEDEDNRRFLADVSEWLGIEIEDVRNPRYPSGSIEEVWEDRQFMAGVNGAPCTEELKFKARLHWQRFNPSDWMVVGFTVDEKARHEDLKGKARNLLPVLIEANITKADCYQIITEAGLKLPRNYFRGYPNGNCPGCVKASSPTYWNFVRVVDPEVFQRRAEQSRKYGAKLVRVDGERIYLDELDPQAKGRPMKSMELECGIMCPQDY